MRATRRLGATCYLCVLPAQIGPCLSLLEWAADVFVAGFMAAERLPGLVAIELRSDRFPSAWHGCRIHASRTPPYGQGVEFRLPPQSPRQRLLPAPPAPHK